MPYSNPSKFPSGFNNGLCVRGVPILNSYTGMIFWVDSNTGVDSGYGTFERPFATIVYAITQCVDDRGDIILVAANHKETIAAAGGLTLNVIGIGIIFLGYGANRGIITFATSVSASILISASSCSIENAILTNTVDQLTQPIDIRAANAYVDVECRDGSSVLEGVRWVLGSAAADKLTLKLRHYGQTGGSHAVNLVRLVGTDGARISIDAYGKYSTALVEFLTTACTDIQVDASYYNSGTTDTTKFVVDTVTGSTWTATGFNRAAGKYIMGGSGLALAFADTATVVANQAVATADGTANTLSRDVVGNKSDAGVQAVTTTASIMAYTKAILDQLSGAAGLTTFPAAAAAANAVSLAEVMRYMSEQQMRRFAIKTIASASASLTTGLSPVTLFTVTGDVMARVFATVQTAITSTGGTGTLAIGVTGNTGSFIAATTADSTNFPTGSVWAGDTSPTLKSEAFSGTALNWAPIAGSANIICTVATNNMTAGAITFYCEYIPLSSGASVVAA